VFNQQLTGAAQVVIADGGDEQPAAPKVGFQTSPGNHQRLFVDFSRSELERQNRFHFEERESGDKPAGVLFGDDSVYEVASRFFAIELRQGARVEEVVGH
jgi:hypothetical protein